MRDEESSGTHCDFAESKVLIFSWTFRSGDCLELFSMASLYTKLVLTQNGLPVLLLLFWK